MNSTLEDKGIPDNSTTFYPPPSQPIDILFGVLYTACLLFGLPGNLVSFAYFYQKRCDFATSIYKLVALNDSLICFFVLFQVRVFPAPSQSYYHT